MRIVCREHPEVTERFLETQDADRRKVRQEHASIRKAVREDKQRRVSIKQLVEQEENLGKRKLELLPATMVVECAKALKSWETEDFGQGHDQGGTTKTCREPQGCSGTLARPRQAFAS